MFLTLAKESAESVAEVSFQSESESETALSGSRVADLRLLSKELADDCNY